jgi:hypothetical protein
MMRALGFGAFSGWFAQLACHAADRVVRPRACILLWMAGGPSQTDTFDMKPGHANGGQFRPISTAVPGIAISEHLPRLARLTRELAIIRSMRTAEGDHGRASRVMHTGYPLSGPIDYPSLGSLVSHELGWADTELPTYVAVDTLASANAEARTHGFLGPAYGPLVVSPIGNGLQRNVLATAFQRELLRDAGGMFYVENLAPPKGVARPRIERRLELLGHLEQEFAVRRGPTANAAHRSAYQRASRMMLGQAATAFRLEEESPETRSRYGNSTFGNSCLLARRLVERGVAFVEVSFLPSQAANVFLSWDTHANNFASVRQLCAMLDPAWSALVEDLKARGLLESTLVVWMGEFGRTPRINGNAGRDHFPAAWSAVLGGCGVSGGQVIGRTSDSGEEVADRPVGVGDLMATIFQALGVDPRKQNISNVGRPIRLADPAAKPIPELFSGGSPPHAAGEPIQT